MLKHGQQCLQHAHLDKHNQLDVRVVCGLLRHARLPAGTLVLHVIKFKQVLACFLFAASLLSQQSACRCANASMITAQVYRDTTRINDLCGVYLSPGYTNQFCANTNVTQAPSSVYRLSCKIKHLKTTSAKIGSQ
jgi:hypothetical protein